MAVLWQHPSTAVEQVLAQGVKDDLPLQAHPLPPTLAQWHDSQATGDYFDQIQPVNVGYLVWSEFPVKVFVQPVEANPANPFIAQRSQTWVAAVSQAIQEWNLYLPLALVEQAETADITIWRSTPPLRLETQSPDGVPPTDRRPPRLQIRARNAETRYEIYVKQIVAEGKAPAAIALAPRFTIYLRPDQPLAYTLATARHELGHALGLWGHSLLPTDALYAMPVRQPPTISVRDVNTLKRVYEQPTRLGWPISR
ncbi:MAG TPA: peptidase [Microcoleaceae cyanobacterium]